MVRRGVSRSALAALCLAGVPASAPAQSLPVWFLGTWSRTLETCSLSDDEDETRLRISADTLKTYRETCGFSAPDLQADGSYRANLACGGRGAVGRGQLRVYLRDPTQAVFFIAVGKARRSGDGVRCAPELPLPSEPVGDPAAAIVLPKLPKSPPQAWLKLRELCSAPATPNRQEVCAERRRLGAQLRAQGMCHVTRGNRESWRACRE